MVLQVYGAARMQESKRHEMIFIALGRVRNESLSAYFTVPRHENEQKFKSEVL